MDPEARWLAFVGEHQIELEQMLEGPPHIVDIFMRADTKADIIVVAGTHFRTVDIIHDYVFALEKNDFEPLEVDISGFYDPASSSVWHTLELTNLGTALKTTVLAIVAVLVYALGFKQVEHKDVRDGEHLKGSWRFERYKPWMTPP